MILISAEPSTSYKHILILCKKNRSIEWVFNRCNAACVMPLSENESAINVITHFHTQLTNVIKIETFVRHPVYDLTNA